MKAAIYSQKKDLETFLYLSKFISELYERGIEVVLHQKLYKDLEFSKEFKTFTQKSDLEQEGVDMFFSFGGDGTILNALLYIQDLNIPVVGVNTGRLGFLAKFTKESIFEEMDNIIEGNIKMSKRSVLRITSSSKSLDFPYALNDVTISRSDTTSMITVETHIDGDFLTTFWADGVIVSTPTGSTAYSLSCGGPIISPHSDNFSLTPIAPHNLNVRPLILEEDAIISFKVESRATEFTLSLDSRLYQLKINEELTVQKANFQLSLIQPLNYSFFNTIRQKLSWGTDKRN
jgi:NAD+ kinase